MLQTLWLAVWKITIWRYPWSCKTHNCTIHQSGQPESFGSFERLFHSIMCYCWGICMLTSFLAFTLHLKHKLSVKYISDQTSPLHFLWIKDFTAALMDECICVQIENMYGVCGRNKETVRSFSFVCNGVFFVAGSTSLSILKPTHPTFSWFLPLDYDQNGGGGSNNSETMWNSVGIFLGKIPLL